MSETAYMIMYRKPETRTWDVYTSPAKDRGLLSQEIDQALQRGLVIALINAETLELVHLDGNDSIDSLKRVFNV